MCMNIWNVDACIPQALSLHSFLPCCTPACLCLELLIQTRMNSSSLVLVVLTIAIFFCPDVDPSTVPAKPACHLIPATHRCPSRAAQLIPRAPNPACFLRAETYTLLKGPNQILLGIYSVLLIPTLTRICLRETCSVPSCLFRGSQLPEGAYLSLCPLACL